MAGFTFRSLALAMLLSANLASVTAAQTASPVGYKQDQSSSMPVVTGAQLLVARQFDVLTGKRVGLITNHTGMVGQELLADLLSNARNTKLTAIFVPEHGFRGIEEAGASVRDSVDQKTGVPMFSLYGETRKPTAKMLQNVDILLFDIQDIGVRFYTYISTMGLAMQAAAEARIPFIVLDRPNPLGGEYVSGYVLEDGQRSFVGQYQIPLIHGLTIGELATLIKGQRLLPGLEALDLRIVEMEGWQRWMRWPDTKLRWKGTSPNITTFETAMVYAGVGLFEATSASDGRGTSTPFTILGAPWIDSNRMATQLNTLELPGVIFEPTEFIPRSIKEASSPRLEGKRVHGIRIVVTDYREFLPLETGIHVLEAFSREAKAKSAAKLIDPADWFNKLAGTKRLLTMLAKNQGANDILVSWAEEVDKYKVMREAYLRY
jgi:uncharacterized protein YbbC (DUF1343 family)